MLECIAHWIKDFPPSQEQQSTLRNLNEMLAEVQDEHGDYKESFGMYVENCGRDSETCRFWAQFVFQDCFAYYLAIRSGKWNLRMTALKLMASLFTAFDRPRYQKLIGQHISDIILHFPDEVLGLLQKGGFSVSITGRACHSVGIDEAHEMCINKECKQYVTRPSAAKMSNTATYLAIRAKAMKNTEAQLFPEKKRDLCIITTLHAKDRESMKLEMNVKCLTSEQQS